MTIYTIGFTKKSARDFFTRLKNSGAICLIDVRLNNVSQLAGFAKRDDLEFFLKAICNMGYKHIPQLAPTQEMLDEYKKVNRDWSAYETRFLSLMSERNIENTVNKETVSNSCLLCSEDLPDHCHRRLVAEYLRDRWGDVQIRHL